MTAPRASTLPHGVRLRPDRGVRSLPCHDGAVLVGGSPIRVLRCNRVAFRSVRRLLAGEPVSDATAGRVASLLVDAGVAHPIPDTSEPGPCADDVTVVVPVRDAARQLARCLAALGPVGRVVVVDDASRRPHEIRAVARAASADLLVRRHNGGPAAARNSGLAACTSPYVAFVDADCVPGPGWLAPLLAHFRDPLVAAVAPRIVGLGGSGWLARYEQVRSSLDLGPHSGLVVPRSRIAYVPCAALVVRQAAIPGGFDTTLRVGEDVDLVWRLHEHGWRVRYEPGSQVGHDHRTSIGRWARRKFDYGSSAGPLARRHPGQVPPVVVSVPALAPLAFLAARRPVLAGATILLSAGGLARRLPGCEGRAALAFRLASGGCAGTAGGIGRAATRAWLPLTVAVLTRRRHSPVLLAAVAAAPCVDWLRQRPRLDLVRWTVAHVLDDASYCAGVWVGALRARTTSPLLPLVPELSSVTRVRRRLSGVRGSRAA